MSCGNDKEAPRVRSAENITHHLTHREYASELACRSTGRKVPCEMLERAKPKTSICGDPLKNQHILIVAMPLKRSRKKERRATRNLKGHVERPGRTAGQEGRGDTAQQATEKIQSYHHAEARVGRGTMKGAGGEASPSNSCRDATVDRMSGAQGRKAPLCARITAEDATELPRTSAGRTRYHSGCREEKPTPAAEVTSQ